MTELRDHLEELAERGEPRGADAVIAASVADAERRVVEPSRPSRAPGRRRATALVALAAVVVLALVVGVLALRDDGTTRARVDGATTASSSTTTTTAPVAPTTTLPAPTISFRDGDFDQVAWIDGRDLVTASSTQPEPRVLARGRVEQPAFSHDGHWLAFALDGSLHTVRADGGGDVDLGATVRPFEWSPVGALLAWSASTDGYGQLRVTDPDTEATRTIHGVGDVTDFAWSPDGRTLAVARAGAGTPVTGFELVGPDGSATRTVAFAPPGGDPLGFNLLMFAGWQPDGDGVLVWIDPGGSGSAMQDGLDLWLVPVDGSEPHLLGTTLVKREWVRWSPDGSRVAIVRSNWRGVEDGQRTVTVCTSDGDCTAISSADVATMDPSWSPDGHRLAYTSKPAMQPLPAVQDGTPNWRVLYAARHLWLANADGSEPREVTDAGDGVASPRWTRDGKLVYVRDDALWTLDVTARTTSRVLGPVAPVPKYVSGTPYQSNLAPPDAPYEAGSNNGFPTWESLMSWVPADAQ